ncbi:MAG: EAL domain-containing protein [Acidobacteria bacterium]|nr:EAL domain-containing protein [Acidobacteriota bacterium]
MQLRKLSEQYMFAVIICGLAVLSAACYRLPTAKIDLNFLLLFCFTIGVGSRLTVQIPKFKSHIAVSDTFIFLALLTYGGELAIILSAVEAFFSSWRFCNRKLTVFFNSAAVAISTALVYLALSFSGLNLDGPLQGNSSYPQKLVVALSIIAVTQFIANTALASVHDALKNELPLWETWKNKYAYSFITYFVGALSAGILHLLAGSLGFVVIFASFPVIFFIFLTYKMYLKNIEMGIQQVELAKEANQKLEAKAVELQESEERFRSAFNHAPIGIALVATDGKWLKVNHALCGILGYTEAEFLAMDFQAVLFPEDLGDTLKMIYALNSGKSPNGQMEQRYIHKTGRTVWTSWSASTATDSKLGAPNLIFQIQDITGRKLAEAKLKHEATHDILTGLPNRKMFMTRLSAALRTASKNRNYKISVLFIDLDRFKHVNDSLGHLFGDQLLVGIADRLRECLRPSDIVARLGGDEFTILVEGNYEPGEVVRIAERVQQKFSLPFDLNGHVIYSSASIGILHASDQHLTAEEMMRDADTAMYQAKRAGKARHEVFDEQMHLAAKETLQLETDLRRAVDNGEIYAMYQPIFSLTTGEILGIEALTRWVHPTLGKIAPARFINIAEEIGTIDALGEYILERTCREIGPILTAMSPEHDLTLSVNLSCRQFGQPKLAENVMRILEATQFPANRLKLEITESIFFEYQTKAIEMLNRIREFGIEIDIDDFGTGYSNLGYLIRLPVSTLKIDRSFVSPIDAEGRNTEIVKTVLALARNLGLKTVAEGIETEHQLRALKELGCDGAQGFLFARPMELDELREYLAENTGTKLMEIPFNGVPVVATLQ